MNQLLRRVQNEVHKDLRDVQGRIVQYQEGHRQLEAQNHHLQEAILTMTAVGACTATTPASVTLLSAEAAHSKQQLCVAFAIKPQTMPQDGALSTVCS